MQKASREKIALAVFALLVVLSLVGLGWYILVGHSWNVAASTIDDTMGEMEGYTAILYKGTLEQDEADEGSASSRKDALSDKEAEPVDFEALEVEYQEKGAEVLVIDMDNLSQYEEGMIVKRESKRIGVMSAQDSVTQLDVSRCMSAFESAQVDFTVVITPDSWKIQRIGGIDIALCLNDEDIAPMGAVQDDTFYVDAPVEGDAGVILVSPSNVVSAKEVSNA